MDHRSLRLFWIFAGTLALAGCDRNNNPGAECKGYVAGDLVITEFMNDPPGADKGQEYFEFYNATGKTIQLRGLSVYYAKTDGSSPKTHVITAGEVPSKGYYVLGDAAAASKPTWESYTFGDTIGEMNNVEGLIGIKCGTTVVDEVKYTVAPQSGHARILDGSLVPDSANNDKETNWCDSQNEFTPGSFGSPGKANEPCGGNPVSNCTDATGASRAIVSPLAGEVVISEFMADPDATSDDSGEWIELYATAPVDLNGLTIWSGTTKSVIAGDTCLHLAIGEYALLAKTTDAAQNGGLPAVTATMTISMPNTSGSLALKSGDTVIDQISYFKTTTGAASQLDTGKLDAMQNDDPNNWCAATTAYGTAAADKGTPGAANIVCPVVIPSDSCIDSSNATRKIVVAAAGDLVISEFMPDPSAVGDTVGEWIEVYANKAVDLNGLEFSCGSSKTVVASTSCIPVAAQGYAVLAHSADPSINGGLPAPAALFSFSLPNTAGTVTIKSGATVIDSTSYTKVTSGASNQLDPAKLDATLNDDPNNFCPGTAPYGTAATDKGTPGAANVTCPVIVPSDSCLDGSGATRKIVVPAAGDLVISEFMPDPTVVGDTLGEWIEVWAKNAVDLNNLELSSGSSKTVLTSTSCLPVAAQAYAILAHSNDPAINGGLPTPIALFSFSLPNTSGGIAIKAGATLIDQITYTKVTSGAASQLDVSKLDATLDDDPTNFCPATTTYGTAATDKGTPGAANVACPVVVPADSCIDSGTSLVRKIVPPAAGDLTISEFMADPNKVADGLGEWFELFVKSDVDLNGLKVGNEGATKSTIVDPASKCIHAAAGSYVVLAHGTDSGTNGGLPAVAATFSFALNNSGTATAPRKINVAAADGTLLDEVSYIASATGASTQLKPDKVDPTSNDDVANWCTTPTGNAYGLGDLGTPGAVNPACP